MEKNGEWKGTEVTKGENRLKYPREDVRQLIFSEKTGSIKAVFNYECNLTAPFILLKTKSAPT